MSNQKTKVCGLTGRVCETLRPVRFELETAKHFAEQLGVEIEANGLYNIAATLAAEVMQWKTEHLAGDVHRV